MEQSPFHAGEQAVQTRLGVRETIEPWARQVVRPHMTSEQREFYASLPYLVAAARDTSDRPWVTILAAQPGFAKATSPETLEVSLRPHPKDALSRAFSVGSDVGILGIDLATRRRNRMNGRVASVRTAGFSLAVDQAFGNCPQFITERAWTSAAEAPPAGAAVQHRSISAELAHWIESSDTFFIASGHRGEGDDPAFGMDASHRGGVPGFVQVTGTDTLVFPDYSGNNHFNTLGNLVADPRVGLLFVDFSAGSVLQLTGRARIDWDSPALNDFPGARRLVHFQLIEAIEQREVLSLRWANVEGEARALRVRDRVRESDDVTSFVLEAEDGSPLPTFEPGQHLPIELRIPDQAGPVKRTYSLSSAPRDRHFRISVKREPSGLASQFLHDSISRGDLLTVRPPAGSFVLEPGLRPVVLISAGIGVTPMVSMLRTLAERRDPRTTWFIHGARDAEHHALGEEVDALIDALPNAHRYVSYSRPGSSDAGLRHDAEGRLDGAAVAQLLSNFDADFYLCGPVAFMARLKHELENLGAPPGRIHYESFGPAGGAGN
jgi:ferredoxin-NADP reductase/predicted pyridoxine 5'-phosphate oxidase superfamily flavin-nucleotide-binding protein